jgi:hypothetical protein
MAESVWAVIVYELGEIVWVDSVHRTETGAKAHAQQWQKVADSGQVYEVEKMDLRS